MRGATISKLVISKAAMTGTGEACAVFNLALGVEQIEQVWREALSGCT